MTSKRRNNAKCPDCNVDGVCPNCGKPIPDATPFSDWLREQPKLDSRKIGFVTTNIDYLWHNYKMNKWMLLEEKRRMADVIFPQSKLLSILDKAAKHDPKYHGMHIIQFENTNPEDGKTYIDKKIATVKQLIDFLRFE